MTKAWKVAVCGTALLSTVSLGGMAYGMFGWPAKLRAQQAQNDLDAVRIAQRERELAQREELLRLENERLDAQVRLAKATSESAAASTALSDSLGRLTKALGVLKEDSVHAWQAEELKRVLDEFNARNKKK